MAIETVQVIRPIKVLALVCGIISLILLVVAVATNSWVEANNYNQGLFKVCAHNADTDSNECNSPDADSKGWSLACGVLIIISLVAGLVVVILTSVGLGTKKHEIKYKLYKVAMGLMFGAFGLALVALILFPIMFIKGLDQKSADMQIHEWYFAWSYGIGWGGAIFELGCAILLLIDQDNEEIYYKEKTVTYHD